ncbi:DedA family protein [Clostridioides difficile]
MDANVILDYLSQYGVIFIFIIVFLEYLNLPGLPAGIIMPLAGLWISRGEMNFPFVLILSVIAGLIGSWCLYFLGFYGGNFLLEKYTNKFPKQKAYIDEKLDYLRSKGNVGVFVSRLIPVARTIIAIPAGVLKMNFLKYTLYSACGIFIWNGVFISAGYILGEGIFKYIG